jgi:hypothetical protein
MERGWPGTITDNLQSLSFLLLGSTIDIFFILKANVSFNIIFCYSFVSGSIYGGQIYKSSYSEQKLFIIYFKILV